MALYFGVVLDIMTGWFIAYRMVRTPVLVRLWGSTDATQYHA